MNLEQVFDLIMPLAILAVEFAALGYGASFIAEKAKNALGLEGGQALALASVIAVIAAILTMIVNQEILPADLHYDNLPVLAIGIFTASQRIYQTIISKWDTPST